MKIALGLAATALVAGSILAGSPAQAAGCGGYVNVWVSGCAPWDNNPRRMPGAPGYVAPRTTAPAVQPRIVQPATNPHLLAPQSGLNNRSGLISDRGGALIGKIR